MGIFTRNGTEVFRGMQVAAFSGIFTGYKKGQFSIEINTRFPDGWGGNLAMMDNLLIKKTPLSPWTVRKILENTEGYAEALTAFETA